MISIEAVCIEVGGIVPDELERWVGLEWVRPDGAPGGWLFREIDVARVRLIRELRSDLVLADEALALVLSLLDQLYDERRRTARMRAAIAGCPEPVRRDLLAHLLSGPAPA